MFITKNATAFYLTGNFEDYLQARWTFTSTSKPQMALPVTSASLN